MDELTDALRRALNDPRRALDPPDDPVREVHRGIRRRRARRATAAGGSFVVVALAAGSALALAPGEDATGQSAHDRPVLAMTPTATPSPSPAPSASPEPSAEPSPTTTTTEGPSFTADTEADVGGPQYPGNGLSVVDARLARQDGYDRVVYELDGEGELAWRVEYVDVATQQGSGFEVELEGRSQLKVTIRGVGYPGDTGIPHYDGPRRLRAPDTQNVTELFLGSVFEGHYESFIGVDGEPRPFRVFALESPTRLVVDVRER